MRRATSTNSSKPTGLITNACARRALARAEVTVVVRGREDHDRQLAQLDVVTVGREQLAATHAWQIEIEDHRVGQLEAAVLEQSQRVLAVVTARHLGAHVGFDERLGEQSSPEPVVHRAEKTAVEIGALVVAPFSS